VRKVYYFLGIFCVALIGLVVLLIFKAGGNRFLRALQLIANSPKEIRSQMKADLFATDNPVAYGGILAGTFGKRVWVWGKTGLKSFVTYQDSVYLFKDRCSEGMRARIAAGFPGDVYTAIETNLDVWRGQIKQGDYVVVRMATKENGVRSVGKLREIHTYNYWPFLRGDMDTLCAK